MLLAFEPREEETEDALDDLKQRMTLNNRTRHSTFTVTSSLAAGRVRRTLVINRTRILYTFGLVCLLWSIATFSNKMDWNDANLPVPRLGFNCSTPVWRLLEDEGASPAKRRRLEQTWSPIKPSVEVATVEADREEREATATETDRKESLDELERLQRACSPISPVPEPPVNEGAAVVLEPAVVWDLTNWKIQLATLLFLMFQYFKKNGRIEVSPKELRKMEPLVPIPLLMMRPVQMVLRTVHIVIVTPGVHTVFQEWIRRNKGILLMEMAPSVPRDTRISEGFNAIWSSGFFGLNLKVFNCFMEQEIPKKEAEFRASLDDIGMLAGHESWALDVIIEVLYFLKSSQWTWSILFND